MSGDTKRKHRRRKSTPIVHPPQFTPESSIVLDVRLEGGSSRPMHFPLLCRIRDVLDIIRPIFPNHVTTKSYLFVTRSGIVLKRSRFLYSYYLDRLEEVSLDSKKSKKQSIDRRLLLPNNECIVIKVSEDTTARGLVQLIPRKPLDFCLDNCSVYISNEIDENQHLIGMDTILISVPFLDSNSIFILKTTRIDWGDEIIIPELIESQKDKNIEESPIEPISMDKEEEELNIQEETKISSINTKIEEENIQIFDKEEKIDIIPPDVKVRKERKEIKFIGKTLDEIAIHETNKDDTEKERKLTINEEAIKIEVIMNEDKEAEQEESIESVESDEEADLLLSIRKSVPPPTMQSKIIPRNRIYSVESSSDPIVSKESDENIEKIGVTFQSRSEMIHSTGSAPASRRNSRKNADKRLIDTLEFDMKALLEVKKQTEEDEKKNILSTRGSINENDIRLKVLVQHTEKTLIVYCDLKDKLSTLFNLILSKLELSDAVGENFGLFHPAQKNRIPSYVTIKSLHMSNDALLIFKHLYDMYTPPKKKKQSAKFRESAKNFLRIPKIPKEDTSQNSSDSDEKDELLPKVYHGYFDSPTCMPVDINILQNFLNWLEANNVSEEEGIFRISASAATVSEILTNISTNPNFDASTYRIHEIAGALKKYLREAEPLIPKELVPELVSIHNGAKVNDNQLWLIIKTLPKNVLEPLSLLLSFVYSISLSSSINLMHLDNLAIIFSPILLRDEGPINLSITSTLSDITVSLLELSEKLQNELEISEESSSNTQDIPEIQIPIDIDLKEKDIENQILSENIEYYKELLISDTISNHTKGIIGLNSEINVLEPYLKDEMSKDEIISLLRLVLQASSNLCTTQNV